MKNISVSFKVGLASLLSIFLLYFGINYLKGLNILSTGKSYYAYYNNIGGLTEGSFVTINGFQVGTVESIEFSYLDEVRLRVNINVEKDIDIPENTIAKIVSEDIMGTKAMSLMLGDSDEVASPGSELKSDIEVSLQEEVNAQILPLKNKSEKLIESIDSLMTVITSVFDQDARSSLSKSLKSLDNTFKTLSSTMKTVDKMVDENEENISSVLTNLSNVSKNINESNTEIKNIIYNFSGISQDLSKSNISSTLKKIDDIADQINSNEGSLGLLINDKKLYNNLQDASKELNILIEDLKDHPEKYIQFSIFGNSKSNKSGQF